MSIRIAFSCKIDARFALDIDWYFSIFCRNAFNKFHGDLFLQFQFKQCENISEHEKVRDKK